MEPKYVMITTKHRGVFAGELQSKDGNSVTLTEARCAIRWNTEHGFLELAETGPNEGSKIGAVAPRIELFDVTSITDVTPEAAAKWKAHRNV